MVFGFREPKRSFVDQLKAISEIDQQLRFSVYLRLNRQYEQEMNPEMAGVLAVQVTNHLMGDDFDKVYSSLDSELQQKVDAIREMIEPKVHEAMTGDRDIRELVIRHIMTTYLIYHCLFDKSWFDRPAIHNREALIEKYGGSEFTRSHDFDEYMAFVSRFIRTTEEEYM